VRFQDSSPRTLEAMSLLLLLLIGAQSLFLFSNPANAEFDTLQGRRPLSTNAMNECSLLCAPHLPYKLFITICESSCLTQYSSFYFLLGDANFLIWQE